MSQEGKAPEVITPSAPPIFDWDAYRETLDEQGQEAFDRVLPVAESLPKNYTIQQAVSDICEFEDIYILPLPSGVYVYRPLNAREEKEIKAIEGIKAEQYRNQIICKCTLAPKITMLTASEYLAGTLSTLYDNILIASDFATMHTEPIKI